MKFDVTYDSNGTNAWIPIEQAKSLLCDAMALESENERLRSSSFVTAVPSEEYEKLKAENERLRKAGDELMEVLESEIPFTAMNAVNRWLSAKEGRDAK